MKIFVTLDDALARHSSLMLLMLLAGAAAAEESNWRTSWDGTLYGYVSGTSVRDDSVLNPGNQMAKLAQRSGSAEARFNFKAESDAVRISARPILLMQQAHNSFGDTNTSESFLSQWQARWRAGETLALSGGRELLNWGPAQFRSPANPFYFNSGRTNPMSELSGMDALRLSWSPDAGASAYVARIFGSGHRHAEPDPWGDSWLAKADLRSDGWAAGAALAQQPGQALFIGAHGQHTFGDEWLVYGEAGSSTRANALQSPPDATQPFAVESESARRSNWLLGASYTAENGQSLAAEYLRYGFGYDANESAAYFSRAANASASFPLPSSLQTLGMALAAAPPLLGRDYVHLVWQSNIMESERYWRLMATHNFTDGGNEISGYGERTLTPKTSAFLLARAATGGARTEFSSLSTGLLTLGVKFALP